MLSNEQLDLMTARLRRGRADIQGGITRRPAGMAEVPPSFGQEQLWFLDRFAPGMATYNIPHAIWLRGVLDAGALGRALDEIVARHEALRTRLIAGADGAPLQRVDEPRGAGMTLDDLSHLEPAGRKTRLDAFLAAEAVRPFVLAEGPLFRARLVRLGGEEHVLVVVVHHAVFDGWSLGVLLQELTALYQAELTGAPSGLTELPIQFADYALWERERMQGPPPEDVIGYWRENLAGLPTLQLPTDRPRPALDSFEGGVEWANLGAEILTGLRELSRREGTTLFAVVLTAVAALLQRYTGQDDIVVGTVSANRGRAKLAPVIGFLLNTLPIRTDLSGDPSFAELIGRVRDTTVGAYAHQDLPFAKLVEELKIERDPGRAPVFQVAVVLGEAQEAITTAGLTIQPEKIDLPAAKFDLAFAAEARGGELMVELSYAMALFDVATIRRMLGHLRVLLTAAVEDPALRLSALPVLTDTELRRELVDWNDTAVNFPQMCVHEGFERQVDRTPEGIAAEFAEPGGESITYAALNADANRIARRLRGLGVGPETLVGVSMERSVRRLAVLLGIMKAGGGYVPLDPALPAERLSFMVADAAMPVVVSDASGAAPDGTRVLRVDLEWPDIEILEAGDPKFAIEPSNLAYAIYTSGSTGRPKGVVVEHRQVINHALGMIEHWPVGPDDRVLQFASLNFDVSVMDMFMTLLSGARVILASTETLLSPPRLARLMGDRKVTIASLPPAVLNLLTGQGPGQGHDGAGQRRNDFPDLRVLMPAGEALSGELVRAWVRPGLRFCNGYGPTEDTVIATMADLDGTVDPPPIGLPVANASAYVLDRHLNPVPVGVVGELHMGGAGVARGYLNAPELTEERFIPDPFQPGARLYKTGDLVRRLPDGNIVYLGRIDGQVKIRGLRVELGEIESVLVSHPSVAQAVVVLATDRTGEKQLVGYVRHDNGGPGGGTAELREHLARRLPGYMIPAHLVTLESFPLNASGKIDRSALPEVDAEVDTTDYVPPQTLLETVLANMYARLLGHERVGAEDGFFDLGGNSLQAMRLITQIDEKLAPGIEVNVTAVFLSRSPRRLAALLRDEHGLDDVDLTDEEALALLES